LTFATWASSGPWTGSYAEEPYNSLNSFIFIDGSGAEQAVRWSLLPAAQPIPVPHDELLKRALISSSRKSPNGSAAVRSAGPWS
jgi:catalase